MTRTTLDDLAAAAENALADRERYGTEPWYPADSEYVDTTDTYDLRFIAAADPTTVLRLVAVARLAAQMPHLYYLPMSRTNPWMNGANAKVSELVAALAALEE